MRAAHHLLLMFHYSLIQQNSARAHTHTKNELSINCVFRTFVLLMFLQFRGGCSFRCYRVPFLLFAMYSKFSGSEQLDSCTAIFSALHNVRIAQVLIEMNFSITCCARFIYYSMENNILCGFLLLLVPAMRVYCLCGAPIVWLGTPCR